jgi:hypothetical protein
MSEDILDLRHAIRTKSSQLRRAGTNNPDAAEEAEILNAMNDVLTDVLESQLPAKASEALRATDAQYAQFKTVEGAIVSSGKKGLTPDALRSSIRRGTSPGKFARGETGALGTLAEQGEDVVKLLGKGRDDEIGRAVRTLDDTQKAATHSSIVNKLGKDGSTTNKDTGQAQLSGVGLTKQLEKNRSSLLAAGFNESDLTRIDRIAKRLILAQRKGGVAVDQLVDDTLGALTNFLATISGVRAAKRVAARTGTTGSLIIPQFFAEQSRTLFKKLNVGEASRLMTDAMQPTKEGRDLFVALMTRPTAKAAKRSQADRTLKAWLSQSGSTDAEDE